MVKVSQIYENTVMHAVLHVKISWLNLCYKIAFRKKKIFSLCLQAKNASGKKMVLQLAEHKLNSAYGY